MSFERFAPQPQDLKTGDLIWPRADKQIVFMGAPAQQPMLVKWFEQKVQVLEQAVQQQVKELDERVANFERDIWVGHVAVIEVIAGVPWVVDATPHRSGAAKPWSTGVAMQPYSEFLADKSHLKSHIWHGRVRGRNLRDGERIAAVARQHLGKPYNLLPFGFKSLTSFYCSKLIWHAVRGGSGHDLREGQAHEPKPWFTPWDVMQSPVIDMLYEPPGRQYIG